MVISLSNKSKIKTIAIANNANLKLKNEEILKS